MSVRVPQLFTPCTDGCSVRRCVSRLHTWVASPEVTGLHDVISKHSDWHAWKENRTMELIQAELLFFTDVAG